MRLIMDKLRERPMPFAEIEQLVCKSQTNRIGNRSVQNYLAELVALGLVDYNSGTRLYGWTENRVEFRSKHDYDIALKHSKNLVLTSSERQGLDHTNPCLALDLLVFEPDRDIDYQCLVQHLQTGYFQGIYKLMERYHQLMDETGLSEIPGFPKLFSTGTSWDENSHMAGVVENISNRDFEEILANEIPTRGNMLLIDVNSAVIGSSSPNIKQVHKVKYKEIVDLRDLLVGRIYSVVNDVIQGAPLQGFCDHCPHRKITIKGK